MILQVLGYSLICAIPTGILCYLLLKFGSKRPDYGTNHFPDPVIHGTIVI